MAEPSTTAFQDCWPSRTSAREALGAMRTPYLPLDGPERVAALARLKTVFAADVAATLDALVMGGWSLGDITDAVASYTGWLHAFFAEAINEGLERWGHLP